MIHVIYIYFIINAFTAGCSVNCDNKKTHTTILFLLFGTPVLIFLGLVCILHLLSENIHFKAFYRLYFTDYYKKVSTQWIKSSKSCYRGEEYAKKATLIERFFFRQLDKKYNYGITSNESKNNHK